jgi:hypothetical protein
MTVVSGISEMLPHRRWAYARSRRTLRRTCTMRLASRWDRLGREDLALDVPRVPQDSRPSIASSGRRDTHAAGRTTPFKVCLLGVDEQG